VIRKGSYKIKVEITPEDLNRISVGTPVFVDKTRLRVSRIYPATSPQSLGIFEADFPSESCGYKLGEILPVKIQFRTLKDVWVVPSDAVLHGVKAAFVFSVGDGKVLPVQVQILAENGDMAALSSRELRKGMPLICAHESRLMTLHKGQPVKVVGAYVREELK
jgi:multidrug efflux pump subunit AcrA (membrane-fusion protein)